MARQRRVRGLQIEQAPGLHRRTMAAQRALWVALLILILTGLAGLFGTGPLSHATATGQGGALVVEYDRFGRVDSPMTLKVHLRPGGALVESVRMWVGHDFLDRIQNLRMVPEPVGSELGPEGVAFVFRTQEAATSAVVVLDYEPRSPGVIRGRVGLDDRPPLLLTKVIYP